MKSFLANEDNVKILGRTLQEDGTRWLILSASGIEFS
ncbi:MAG TPA: GDSL family lipase, partial [Treponema sp.]|nr:GDSL family lipase [Treponema sp.]